jgi:hypothetical protein
MSSEEQKEWNELAGHVITFAVTSLHRHKFCRVARMSNFRYYASWSPLATGASLEKYD